MAKVSGPLMSMSASGQFAGSMVFGAWKGQPYVRQLVTPSNPKSAGQETARNATRTMGAVQKFIARTTTKRNGQTKTDKLLLGAKAPSGRAWNGYLVQVGIGTMAANYTAAQTAYTALTAPQKAAWDAAAVALVPPISAVAQTGAGGVAAASLSGGNVHFIGQYALFSAGVANVPTGVPPAYA